MQRKDLRFAKKNLNVSGNLARPKHLSVKALFRQGNVPLSQYINPSKDKISNINNRTPPVPDKFKAIDPRKAEQSPDYFANTLPAPQTANQHTRKKQEVTAYSPLSFGALKRKMPPKQKVTTEFLLQSTQQTKPLTNNVQCGVKPTVSQKQLELMRCITPPKVEQVRRGCSPVENVEIQKSESNALVFRPIKFFKECKKQLINYKKFNQIFEHAGLEDLKSIELNEIIGTGANANVRLGLGIPNGKKYAIKIYEKYRLQDSHQKRRVMKEIEILLDMRHDNVITLINAYENKREIHMVFEYIDQAVTLQDYIRLRNYNIDASEKLQIIEKVTRGLDYLHKKGIYHRDMKTDNILLTFKGFVKIIDFGYSTRSASSEISCGTPSFMAPELFGKNSYNSEKGDIWALGILIYYLFEGEYPFRGYTEKELVKNIRNGVFRCVKSPKIIQQITSLCIKVTPEDRISCEGILEMLHE